MKKLLLLLAMLCGSGAMAATLYFDGSQAAGTERMTAVKRTEFLFAQESGSLRLCGLWFFADGKTERFEHRWGLTGSEVRKDGRVIGSYYDGNFMIEEHTGANKYLSLEVSRYNETFFEYHFHHPDFGFVDADGWIRAAGSVELKATCEL